MLNQKQAARQFVDRWEAEEGNEDRQSRSFWIELANKVLGIDDPTHVLEFERKVKGRKIDVFYEDMSILIEQKSRGVDLDKKSERSKKAGEETPYQQAKWYADNLPNSVRPDWIIVSNFDEFRIHSLNSENPEHEYVSLTLDELPEQLHLLSFFTDKSSSRLVKEKELSVQAGEIVGRLYKSLAAQYKNIDTNKHEQRSLNILIVRFVFLLYAEDAGILQEHHAFLNYMRNVEPEDMREALIKLFEVLDTPEDKRDPYLSEKLSAFPYINGSLFAEDNIVIPQFTPQIKFDLLKEASQEFDWSGISPTIFGAAFESTLNPDTRREGGMHYTSIENIHKVIDPLFLDDLKAELAEIEGIKVEKTRNIQLKRFQNKLASIKILDPACGSGNFLTESYLSLRKLENRVLESLMGDQMGFGFTGTDEDLIKVSIDQFYGIEINDFAVAVAKTALWIAEEQMMDITQDILLVPLRFLPLTSNKNIHEGNALRMDWDKVLPAEECNYIIGNPPFVGQALRTKEQSEDMALVFGKGSKETKLDYVLCWYRKALEYMLDTDIVAAFVSTNSIVQGESVPAFWKSFILMGAEIQFAYRSFKWASEATGTAVVSCVIVAFSAKPLSNQKRIFDEGQIEEVTHINAYLMDAPDVWIESRSSKPPEGMPKLTKGSEPTDNGQLFLTSSEREYFISQNPELERFIKPFIGAKEFVDDPVGTYSRYVFWFVNDKDNLSQKEPSLNERFETIRNYRLKNSADRIRAKADTPQLFCQIRQPDSDYIIVPRHTSSRRDYIPLGFISKEVIAEIQQA